MTDYVIRTISKDDLDALVELHVATFGSRDNSLNDVRRYHERMLEHVLCDVRVGSPAPHSLVSVYRGDIVAMIYGAHSPMLLGDRRIWATSSTLLAVHPDHRNPPCTGGMIRAVLDSGYDLIVADRTTRQARIAAQHSAAVDVLPHYSLRWSRVVNPAAAMVGGTLNRSTFDLPRVTTAVRRALGVVDAAVSRSNRNVLAVDATRARRRRTTSVLTAEDLTEHGPALLEKFALRPDVTSPELTELAWARFRALRPEGRLERVAVWNRKGEMVGWYLLHVMPTGIAEALQLVGRDHAIDDVISLLLQHAKDLGVGSVHGGASPSLTVPLSEAGAYFHGRNSAFIARSDDDEISTAARTTQALFTGLELEYPMMLASRTALED